MTPPEKKVLVATPSWNRKSIITLVATALKESELALDTTDYLVSDDASTEYSEVDLKAMFPWADVVRHSAKFHNHLMNTHFCFSEFLRGPYEYLVILDSDMIVTPNWRSRLDDLVATPDFKIGSLYNSTHHKIVQDCNTYIIKESAGFAGMVFSRKIIEELRLRLGSSHDDWAVCRHLGPVFRVCQPSALAHIGINGRWNGGSYSQIDKAADFPWTSVSPELKSACEQLLQVIL